MKLVTFLHNNNLNIGAVKDDLIISFAQSSLPKNMIDFIELGNDGLDTANDLIEKGEKPIEGRTILWTFPSEEDAKAWYNDPQYQELAKIRRSSAILNNLSIIKSLPKRS